MRPTKLWFDSVEIFELLKKNILQNHFILNHLYYSSSCSTSFRWVTRTTMGHPNLLEATLKASFASAKLEEETYASYITWLGCILAASPVALPNALLIPSCSLSAPAVAIILFSLKRT